MGGRASDRSPLTPETSTFDRFYRANYRSVVATAYAVCADRAVAEELTQDAFLTAHRRWQQIRDYEQPAGWVRRVVINRARSHRRRRSADSRARIRVGPIADGMRPPERDDELWAAVRGLPRRQLEVVVLHVVGGHPLEEVAQILQIAPSTARVHFHRARHTLADRLGMTLGDDDT